MKPIVQKIVVAGVLIYKNKALIIQRNKDEDVFPNLWEIPSGKRELFEKSQEALIREMKEEVGVEIKILSPVDVFEFKVEKENETRDSTQISFLCKLINNSEVKLSGEHQNFAWISENEIDNYELSDETKDVIKKTFKLKK